MSLKKRLEKMFWVQEDEVIQPTKPQSKSKKEETHHVGTFTLRQPCDRHSARSD